MGTKHLTPHDHFLRHMMTKPQVIKEFFEINLPANIKEIVDLDSIKPQQESYIDDKLRLQITDLVYTAQIGRRQGYLYLLVEHQSTPDRMMPFRLIKYTLAVMEQHLHKNKTKELPIVYPLIIYTGNRNYTYSTDLFDLFGTDKKLAQDIFWKPYQLIDYSQIPDEKLRQSLMYGVLARVMKHIYEKDIVQFLKSIIGDLKDLENSGESDYIYTILTYLAKAGEIRDPEEFREIIKLGLSNIDEEKIMTFVEHYRQQGEQVGFNKAAHAVVLAIELLKQGLRVEQVAQQTNLPIETIENLKQNLR
jgi:predicted transposase/invertase (TIGR01784 family)